MAAIPAAAFRTLYKHFPGINRGKSGRVLLGFIPDNPGSGRTVRVFKIQPVIALLIREFLARSVGSDNIQENFFISPDICFFNNISH
jgi:hypothetical protein